MNGSTRIIDARGQACPAPVILLKKALEAGGQGPIGIIVDNEAARENVSRFARKRGCAILASTGAAPEIVVTVAPPAGEGGGEDRAGSGAEGTEAASDAAPTSAPSKAGEAERPLVILLASDRLGGGNEELGALLMRGLIYALAEREELPEALILMNHGVLLAIEGSDSLANLRRLEEGGVEVLACGTCLEFLGVKDRLGVGRVSNMYEIAERLSTGRLLSL